MDILTENCRYEIKAKMLAVSKVFRPVDILTVLLQIATSTKPHKRIPKKSCV